MTTIFDRLARGRPAPAEEKTKQQPKQLAEALLGWLERWPKPTVSSRDIRIWGPKLLSKNRLDGWSIVGCIRLSRLDFWTKVCLPEFF